MGLGYCLKPLDPLCISGRANHDCYYFENNLQNEEDNTPDCCQQCTIRYIGSRALASGSSLYIMTSARDILFDVFLPAMNSNFTQTAVFGLCHYSLEPFKMALHITDINATLFTFESGDCRDYSTWRKADKGIKLDQTKLKNCDMDKIIHILNRSDKEERCELKYLKKQNVFVPLLFEP